MTIYKLLEAYECVGIDTSRIRVIVYIFEHVDPVTYEFHGTYGEIVKGTGVTYSTVTRTMRRAQEVGLIKRIGTDVWHIEKPIFTGECNENYDGPEIILKNYT